MPKLLILLGSVLVIGGLILHFGGGRFFSWFGHLPGDIRSEGTHTRFYFPWVSMLVVSVLLNLVLWLWRRWGG